MKKILAISILFFAFSSISIAQSSRKSSSRSDSPRADRKVAITTEGGWKTMSGTGINVSYYPITKLAIDAGAGLGLQGFKTGARVRYLFLDQEFTPIIGLGFNVSPQTFSLPETQTLALDIDFDPETPDEIIEADISINRSYYAQAITGIEWMSKGGFVVAFNIGFRASLNETLNTNLVLNGESYEIVDQFTDEFVNSVTRIYGSGLSTSLHLGYAF